MHMMKIQICFKYVVLFMERGYFMGFFIWLQIGRSSENQIDCIVMDTVAGAVTFDDLTVPQSTISRYACRIVVSRHPPCTARVYAAGFDASKNIFLGV